MRKFLLLVSAAIWSAPALAAPTPALADFAVAERATVRAAVAAATQGREVEPTLAELDRLLTEVPGPTAGRGMIQMIRAGLLSGLNREREAQLAIQESIRLLPDFSGPLFTAAGIMTFSGTPGVAADYFIRGSRIDPELAAGFRSYDVFNLLNRLRHAGDQQRIEALTDRLIQINWVGDDLHGRSALVRQAILLKLKRKDVAGARALVSELLDPRDHYGLLAQKVAEPIWSDIEAWTGPRLEKQWPVYLREARRRFGASNDLEDGGSYLDALVAARKDADAISTFLPLFTAEERDEGDEVLLLKASALAGALGRQGRFAEQDRLFARLGQIWPLGSTTNALNLTGNHARWLLIRGEAARSLAMIEATIAAAEKAGAEVNGDALAAMHQTRACALATGGRRDDAQAAAQLGALSATVAPAGVARMHLCLGEPEKAKAVLLRALSAEISRPAMVVALQPSNGAPAPTAFARAEQQAWDKLRGERQIVAALRREGRMLGFAVGDGAPAVLPD